MGDIQTARGNCAAAISQHYCKFGLLADILDDNGAFGMCTLMIWDIS